jgi:two-component system phosphate regulon sensor histidine kinase PhoR
MKKSSLWLISILMSLALLGVFVMQMYYIKESYYLKSQLFEQTVNQALGAVVNKIQKRNVIRHINRQDNAFQDQRNQNIRSQTDTIVAFKLNHNESEIQRKYKQRQEILDYLGTQDSIIHANFLQPEIISEEDYAILSNPNPNNNTLNFRINDIRSKDGTLLRRNVSPVFKRKKVLIDPNRLPDSIIYLAFSPVDFIPKFIILPTIDQDLKAKFSLEDAKAAHKYKAELERLYADTIDLYNNKNINLIKDVAKELERKDVPLQQRIPTRDTLKELIKSELSTKNIDLDFHFWVSPAQNNNTIIYRSAAFSPSDMQSPNTFHKAIFSDDLVTNDQGRLYISFPHKNSAILGNMTLLLISSAGLLLVLIFIFTFTLLAIIRQKKLSEMKTDFINNMTHEFKTPVATIMIASEALKDADIQSDQSRVNRLAGIIYDENVRLGDHIEHVLSVARLDRKELKLAQKPITVHDIIHAVTESMSLQLQKRSANISLNLNAQHDTVIGDELHFSNIIFNLVDNANKYSLGKPEITIETRNSASNLIISISDKGIGMTREQTKRIFDQFYRVPTGNLHDVKGFGLGLSYVNDVLTQMGATIKVHSEKDKGTTFEISIAYKKVS